MDLPFKEKIYGTLRRRTFDNTVDDDELKWHQDLNNRKVTIIESDNWYFQMENELPKKLTVGDTLFIPKGVYHRVIKGNGDLVITILEDDVINES